MVPGAGRGWWAASYCMYVSVQYSTVEKRREGREGKSGRRLGSGSRSHRYSTVLYCTIRGGFYSTYSTGDQAVHGLATVAQASCDGCLLTGSSVGGSRFDRVMACGHVLVT